MIFLFLVKPIHWIDSQIAHVSIIEESSLFQKTFFSIICFLSSSLSIVKGCISTTSLDFLDIQTGQGMSSPEGRKVKLSKKSFLHSWSHSI